MEERKNNYNDGFNLLLKDYGESFEEEIEKEKLHVLDINERQKKAIKHVKSNGSIARNEYMEINNVSHKTAHLELKKLVEKNIFIQEGKGRSTKYILLR